MPSERHAPYRLTLLGPWDLRGPDEEKVRSVLSQPKRLCLLAYLALCAEPVARSTLVALFWPESDEDRARNALSQALHYLRRSLGPNAVESVEGDRLLVSAEQIWFDARVLLAWKPSDHSAMPHPGAPADVAGLSDSVLRDREFFPGWNAEDSQPLQEWLDGVRRRVEIQRASLRAEFTHDRDQEPTSQGDDGDRPEGRSPRASKATWVGTGLVLGVVLVVLGGGPLVNRPPTEEISSAPASLGPSSASAARLAPAVAVLLPRVTFFGEARPIDEIVLAQAVHDEVVARLEGVSSPEIVSIGFESDVSQLVRSLAAQGAGEVPRWILTVSIRGGGDRARVVGLLLEGPDYTTIGAASEGDYLIPIGAGALVDFPGTIAAEVVKNLRGGLLTDSPDS